MDLPNLVQVFQQTTFYRYLVSWAPTGIFPGEPKRMITVNILARFSNLTVKILVFAFSLRGQSARSSV